jgi:predicted DNA-binding WGR domain protein
MKQNGGVIDSNGVTLCGYCYAKTKAQAKILKEPKVEKLNEITLYFQDEKSDKVYKAWIEQNAATKWYQIRAEYGRRGGTLTETSKGSYGLKGYAVYHLNKLVSEKQAKGYKLNLTEAYSPLNETAATPNQIKLIKSYYKVVPPGLTKKQAQFMVEQYQNNNKPSYVYPKPMKLLPKKPSTIGAFPHKVEPAPPKEEPLVVSGPTGRRIKEID